MTNKFENLPELEAAFEAVKGQLFGPVDPALAKLKHKQILQDDKEKREQALDPHGRLRLAGDDRAERDRKDRAEQTRTLTWLLAHDRAHREAHERAMASFTGAGNAIDRAIEAGETARKRVQQQIDDYLASTARLKDGRYVMAHEDGTYRDQDGQPISAKDAEEVEGEPKKAFKAYDDLRERQAEIDHDLAELRGWGVEVGDMHNKANDEDDPASRKELDDMTERADDLAAKAAQKQREFEQSSPQYSSDQKLATAEATGSSATMAMPQIP